MTVAKNRSSTIEVAVVKGDIRTIQRGKTWAQFEHLQQGFENTRGVKLSFYNNTIATIRAGSVADFGGYSSPTSDSRV